MKWIKSPWLVAVLAMLGLAAAAPRYLTTPDLSVRNATDTVGLTIRKTGTTTSNFVEIFNPSGTLKFTVPATGVLPITYGGSGASTAAGAKTALGIQVASVTTADDGTVTNTFGTAFSGVPSVIAIPIAPSANVLTNVLASVTTSNSVHNIGASNVVLKIIAIGAP